MRARSEFAGASGYLHRGYAESFSDIAIPRELRRCGGWILERAIPGSELCDGMGCYPLFACRDWRGLALDLPTLAGRLVSLTLITDPFGDFTGDDLTSILRGRRSVQATLCDRSGIVRGPWSVEEPCAKRRPRPQARPAGDLLHATRDARRLDRTLRRAQGAS